MKPQKKSKQTKKEILVLQGIQEGKRCKTIAEEMNITIWTVNTHCKNMMGKFDKHRITAVLSMAIKEGNL